MTATHDYVPVDWPAMGVRFSARSHGASTGARGSACRQWVSGRPGRVDRVARLHGDADRPGRGCAKCPGRGPRVFVGAVIGQRVDERTDVTAGDGQ